MGANYGTPPPKPGSFIPLHNPQHLYNHQMYNQPAPDPNAEALKLAKDQLDWAKFAMWLRGFLAAVEGQPLTPETVGKIMEKLATVDPERRLSYTPLDYGAYPGAYPQYPASQPWQYQPSVTYPSTSIDSTTFNDLLREALTNANTKSPNISSTKLTAAAINAAGI